MKRENINFSFKVLLVIIIFLLPVAPILNWAEGDNITIVEDKNGDTVYFYVLENPIELRGVKGQSQWYFEVDKTNKIKSFDGEFILKLSPMIIKDLSYITIYLNDIPVYSEKLSKTNEDEEINFRRIKLSLPVENMNTGFNSLTFQTNTRISERVCEDDLNIANWVLLDGKSNYKIVYEKKNGYPLISDFPKPFYYRYTDLSKGTALIIPENYKESEISSGLTLISHMKSVIGSGDFRINLMKYNGFSHNEYDSIIYIGSPENIPDEFNNNRIKKITEKKNEAYIIRSETKDEKPIMLILSSDEEGLQRTVRALVNKDLREQMVTDEQIIGKEIDVFVKEGQLDERVYLSELGIGALKLEGKNRQVANISFKIPADQNIATESSINLKYRYSDNINDEKSLLSVYLNGRPVGSTRLDRKKRDGDEITFYIPKDLRNNSYYDIQIVSELILQGNYSCEEYEYSQPWVFILEDSSFFIPKKQISIMKLENLPYPFIEGNDISDTAIILPDDSDINRFKIATEAAKMIGSSIDNNRGIITAISADKFDVNYYNYNLFVVGSPENNSMIKEINDKLWFRYDDKFSRVMSNEKIELLDLTGKRSTFMEIKQSPYLKSRGMLTITSLDRKSLMDSLSYLDASKIFFLMGDAVIINHLGDVKSFVFQKEKTEEAPLAPMVNSNLLLYVGYAVAILIFLIIGFTLHYFRYRKKK